MCFSPAMSLSLAFVGIIGTIICLYNHKLRKTLLCIPFIFYTFMELLQAWQYTHANQCGSKVNLLSTEIAYILVIVQPLLWNLLFYISANGCEKNLFLVGIVSATIWMIVNIAQRFMYPGLQVRTNDTHSYNGKESGCTRRNGTEHIYWQWKFTDFKGVDANWLMYLVIWFIPAFLSIKFRKIMIITFIFAAFAFILAKWYYNNTTMFASLWCLYSIPTLILLLVSILYW